LKVVALAGGTGSAKLLLGLHRLPIDLTVVANVGDNFWTYGVYVCPDIDITIYTLAGLADRSKGWGIAGDTFEVLSQISRLGAETWFRLGDRDMALCLLRTELMREGDTLTGATERARRALRVDCPVLPVTDDPVETRLVTSRGDTHLQEFWVRDGGRPRVFSIRYKGAKGARLSARVASALADADRIVVCPANPVTSIGPILAIPGLSAILAGSSARVVALSPMQGSAPFSGPARKLMRAMGSRPDSVGVARLYSRFLDGVIISDSDSAMRERIEKLGVHCITTDTRMKGPEDEQRLSKVLLEV
jgi:LPPG:FO 2-phospho-L-lactate transferase